MVDKSTSCRRGGLSRGDLKCEKKKKVILANALPGFECFAWSRCFDPLLARFGVKQLAATFLCGQLQQHSLHREAACGSAREVLSNSLKSWGSLSLQCVSLGLFLVLALLTQTFNYFTKCKNKRCGKILNYKPEPIFLNPLNPCGVLGAYQCVERLSFASLTRLDVFLYIFSRASTFSQCILVVAWGNLRLPAGRVQVINRANTFPQFCWVSLHC